MFSHIPLPLHGDCHFFKCGCIERNFSLGSLGSPRHAVVICSGSHSVNNEGFSWLTESNHMQSDAASYAFLGVAPSLYQLLRAAITNY